MKKNSIVAVIAMGMLTLGTASYAWGSARTKAPSAVITTNGSDVTLMPGAGADTLRLHFSGAEIITREAHGGLMIVKARGQLLHYRPEAYQLINGEMKSVEVSFRIEGTDQVIIQFSNIDKNAPVILKQGAVMSQNPTVM